MTTEQSHLDRVAVPAISVEQLALHLIDQNLEYVKIAAGKKPDETIKTFIQLDVFIDADDLVEVARKHGLLPPALDKRPPAILQKTPAPVEDRWVCLVCRSGRRGHHGAMDDGTPCVNGAAP